MKPLSRIVFGFSDAENYRRRENKELFNRIFLRTDALDELCKRNIFFLVGEKGTGKTAYAVYLSNSPYKDNISSHRFIRETDYQKFISLKKNKHLGVSDYADIWKVIIYLLISDSIYRSAGNAEFLMKYGKFKALRAAIDEYYGNAFSPEIPIALQFVEDSSVAASVVAKHVGIQGKFESKESSRSQSQESRFQLNMLFLQKQFETALESLNLSKSTSCLLTASTFGRRASLTVSTSSASKAWVPRSGPSTTIFFHAFATRTAECGLYCSSGQTFLIHLACKTETQN